MATFLQQPTPNLAVAFPQQPNRLDSNPECLSQLTRVPPIDSHSFDMRPPFNRLTLIWAHNPPDLRCPRGAAGRPIRPPTRVGGTR